MTGMHRNRRTIKIRKSINIVDVSKNVVKACPYRILLLKRLGWRSPTLHYPTSSTRDPRTVVTWRRRWQGHELRWQVRRKRQHGWRWRRIRRPQFQKYTNRKTETDPLSWEQQEAKRVHYGFTWTYGHTIHTGEVQSLTKSQQEALKSEEDEHSTRYGKKLSDPSKPRSHRDRLCCPNPNCQKIVMMVQNGNNANGLIHRVRK